MEIDLIELAERLETCDYGDPVVGAAIDGYRRTNSNYYSSNIAGALRAVAALLATEEGES